ncbi:MAG TPA: TolC family protein [Geobacteraceae bacterium]|nr:TolC family protein [Geobacteraceae bacterium]
MRSISLIVTTLLCLSASAVSAESLTLRECLAKASTGNYSLRVATHDEKIAAEGIGIARSGFLPRIDLQGGYTAQLEPQSIQFDGVSIATQDADYPFLSLTIYQTIYDFGRTDSRYRRAQAAREATSYSYAGQEKEVFLQVVKAYFGILQDEKLQRAAEEEVTQMADHLRVAQNFYDQGVVTRNDLLQAEVRLATSRQRALEEGNRLTNGWLSLNYLIGNPPEFRSTLEEGAAVAPATPPADPEKAFAGRAEVNSLKKLIEGNDQEVRENRGNYYPEIYAQMGLDYVKNGQVKEQTIYAGTVGLKINLFDGLATTSRLRQAVETRSRSEEALRQLQADIRLEYMTATNDAKVALERIKVAQDSIRQGEENLRINKDRYQAQVGTATDVIDAQTLLTQTKTEYFRALFDYQVAVARVKKSLGEL